jgi:hypothetical protein
MAARRILKNKARPLHATILNTIRGYEQLFGGNWRVYEQIKDYSLSLSDFAADNYKANNAMSDIARYLDSEAANARAVVAGFSRDDLMTVAQTIERIGDYIEECARDIVREQGTSDRYVSRARESEARELTIEMDNTLKDRFLERDG